MTPRAAVRPASPSRIRPAARLRCTLAGLALLLGAACVPVERHHGYVPSDEDLAAVTIGQTTEAELATLLGRPAAQGLLTGSGWFYVGSTFRHYGALKPQETRREVVALSFDSRGTVANVERFGLEDGRVVVLSRRVTDPGVSGMSALRQVLGNIGRISAGQIID